jgi:PBP1b-binding outer membrane lipoprotein LpoB
MRTGAAILLALLLAACTAEQAGSSARSACRANPTVCTDPATIPAMRGPGG